MRHQKTRKSTSTRASIKHFKVNENSRLLQKYAQRMCVYVSKVFEKTTICSSLKWLRGAWI